MRMYYLELNSGEQDTFLSSQLIPLLHDEFMRSELFSLYKDDMQSTQEKYISYSYITRLWKSQFNNVSIPRKVRVV